MGRQGGGQPTPVSVATKPLTKPVSGGRVHSRLTPTRIPPHCYTHPLSSCGPTHCAVRTPAFLCTGSPPHMYHARTVPRCHGAMLAAMMAAPTSFPERARRTFEREGIGGERGWPRKVVDVAREPVRAEPPGEPVRLLVRRAHDQRVLGLSAGNAQPRFGPVSAAARSIQRWRLVCQQAAGNYERCE